MFVLNQTKTKTISVDHFAGRFLVIYGFQHGKLSFKLHVAETDFSIPLFIFNRKWTNFLP